MRARGQSPLAWILVVALAVRVAVIVATPDFRPIFDASDYIRHAASIADGHGYPSSLLEPGSATAFRPPLYPLALAGVHKLGGGWTAERCLGVLLGVVTVLLVFLIARRLWGERVALFAGAIAAVFPPLFVFSASLLSENLFLPLTLAALLAALVYRDDRRLRWAIAAGVLCGLAGLTRTSGLPTVLALALGVWTVRPRLSRAALAAPVALLAATAITVAPWVVRNTIAFDRFVGVSTATGFAVAGTYSAESSARAEHPGQPFTPLQLGTFRALLAQRDLDEAELTGTLNDRGIDYASSHPGYVVETAFWNVARILDIERTRSFEATFSATTVQALHVGNIDVPILYLTALYVVVALALLGAFAQLRRAGPARAPAFVWLVPALNILPALLIYGIARYRAPVDPFLVMLAAIAIVAALDRRRRAV